MEVVDLTEQKFSRLVREVYAAHVVFMSVGVDPDFIFVLPDAELEDGRRVIGIKAVCGEDEHFVALPFKDGDPAAFAEEWVRAAKAIRHLPHEERVALCDGTHTRARAVEIIAQMVMKGYVPKYGEEK